MRACSDTLGVMIVSDVVDWLVMGGGGGGGGRRPRRFVFHKSQTTQAQIGFVLIAFSCVDSLTSGFTDADELAVVVLCRFNREPDDDDELDVVVVVDEFNIGDLQ
jgi:hypothetical protein